MTENGIRMYDLAGNWCEECGHPKMNRLFDILGTCKTCNEAITRHRCTKRPDLDVGQSWECPDCGTIWTAGEEKETCGECGQGTGIMRRTWDSVPGDRIDSAPRHKPEPWTPLRNALRGTVNTLYAKPKLEQPSFGTCHRTDKGIMIHVKPGCRC